MKYLEMDGSLPTLELTRRNLETLLAKLDDPNSLRMLIDGENKIAVRAVENNVHYADRAPGEVATPEQNAERESLRRRLEEGFLEGWQDGYEQAQQDVQEDED